MLSIESHLAVAQMNKFLTNANFFVTCSCYSRISRFHSHCYHVKHTHTHYIIVVGVTHEAVFSLARAPVELSDPTG